MAEVKSRRASPSPRASRRSTGTSGTSSAPFAARLRQVLVDDLKTAGINAEVRTEAVPTTKLHRVLVTARQFKQLPPSERQDLVWRIVGRHFNQEEQLLISMIVTLTPDEMAGK